MNKTKIIATVGPSCAKKEILQEMIDNGVSCFRINMSHGSKDSKTKYFDLIKSLITPSGQRPTILADLAGPKIRVDDLEDSIKIKKGDLLKISNENVGQGIVPVSKGIKFKKVNPGAKILIDDGRISLNVIKHITDRTLQCEASGSGIIESKKGVNFPDIDLNVPVLTNQDLKDLELSLNNGADWIAMSFVKSHSDYQVLNEKVKSFGYNTPIMAKIEKWDAVQDLDKIIEAFDSVMVARGDLGVELPLARVPLIQKNVIERANNAGKPVIIATQILDSMTQRTVPTRAEVSDIANAIFDGTDALMVTGETAVGKYPNRVIKVLSGVIKETEGSARAGMKINEFQDLNINTARAISHAACSVAKEQGIRTLVTMTHSGSTARMIARYRPSANIIAMTPFDKICRQLAIVWGITPVLVIKFSSTDEVPAIAKQMLVDRKLIYEGERFVITGGVPVGVPGTTNYLSVLKTD